MAAKERVLKFERSDAQQCILINVKSKGSKALDLKLEAIDFEFCYVNNLKHDRVASLRTKNCPVSEPEWRQILEKLFDQEPQQGIQATGSVDNDSISLVVRKSVQGITQRLGTITIPKTDDEFNVLDWAGTAVDTVVETKKKAAEATAKADQLETEVKELNSQLDELVRAKDDDETAMLQKFRDLLNEKKVKIREQQKIIADGSARAGLSSSQSQQASQAPPQTSLPSRSRKPQQSRTSKRKQPAVVPEESSDDGFEPMEVDKIKEEEETANELDSEATASVDSEDENGEPFKSPGQINTAIPSQNQPPSPRKKKQITPPPKRALPFMKDKSKPEPAPVAQPTGESETDSDDEL